MPLPGIVRLCRREAATGLQERLQCRINCLRCIAWLLRYDAATRFFWASVNWSANSRVEGKGDADPVHRAIGVLKPVGDEWTRGDYPRSFTFDPTGGFLYCCNQRADNITTFRMDRKTGWLELTGQYTPVDKPSHIVFLDLKKGG
jgi:hypothetical protein